MAQVLTRAQEWLETTTLEGSTSEKYVYSLGLLVRSGIATVEQINRTTIRRFMLSRLRAGATAATVNYDLAAFCSFLSWLEKLGEFPLSTIYELRTLYLEQELPPPPDFLTPEQFLRLRASSREVDAVLELAVAIGVHTGLRFDEIRKLWFDDFELNAPHPFLKVQRTHGRRIKTKRERTVPFPRAFADELRARGFLDKVGPVFPPLAKSRSRYVHFLTLRRYMDEARKRAQIQCNWITLRHTYASWLVQANVSITKVAKFLGNSVHVCFKHYAALIPGGDLDVERGFEGLSRLTPS